MRAGGARLDPAGVQGGRPEVHLLGRSQTVPIGDEDYRSIAEGKPIVEMPYSRAKAHRQVPRTVRELLAERVAILAGDTMDVAA